MPVTFSAEDLGRVFEARTLTRGRSLVLIGTVQVSLTDDTIGGVIGEGDLAKTTSLLPRIKERHVEFDAKCSCGQRLCTHLAATALAALDRFPALRKPEQKTFLDNLTASPEKERQRLVFDISSAQPPNACMVTAALVGERTGRLTPITPAQIGADRAHGRRDAGRGAADGRRG